MSFRRRSEEAGRRLRRLALLLAILPLGAAGPALADGLSAAERARAVEAVRPATDFRAAEPFEANSAGAATVRKPINASVFSHPSGNMSFERQLRFRVGDGVFRKLWVSAPSSTTSSDGLGPLFNARGCQNCHLKDGRGRPPEPGEAAVSLFLKLSVPPQTPAQHEALADRRAAAIPEPTYGGQLQNFSVPGVPAEARLEVDWEEVPVRLADGEAVSLRRPTWRPVDLAYGPMRPDVMLSPRVAPAMLGMGLLEAIPEADILAHADPEDRDGDGIAGRPNQVWDPEAGRLRLGRFGWKAGQPSIRLQSAAAFAGDMGLSTPVFRASAGDCTAAQAACLAAPDGADPQEGVEVTADMLDLVVFYAHNLGVPARRKEGASQVLAGKKLFYEAGCTGCHVPKFVTGRDPALPEQSFQLIWPYTDLLLHDMGEGLADGRPEGDAGGRDWRTPPLWGIGLTGTVSGHTQFLHDGRARNLLEAILWHGGEAQRSRDRVAQMSARERAALLAFLNSL